MPILAQGKVRDQISKSAGVGHGTVDKFKYIEAKDPKLADALCTGSYDEYTCGVLKDLIPALADHEREGLEEDIKHFGCYCPIITWQGYIIDGHHCYEICMRHKLSFRVEEREFDDEDAVMIWMIDNQMGRRNITDAAKIKYGLLRSDIEKDRARKRMLAGKKPEGDPSSRGFWEGYCNCWKGSWC